MKNTFKVQQTILGKDRKENFYFVTLEEAEKFYQQNNYTSKPIALFITDKRRQSLLEATKDKLEFEKNGYWI